MKESLFSENMFSNFEKEHLTSTETMGQNFIAAASGGLHPSDHFCI